MRDVTETPLPGVGVRFEFTSGAGERVGVLVHRGGRRELMVYDAADRQPPQFNRACLL